MTQDKLAREFAAIKAQIEPRPWDRLARYKQLPPDHPRHHLPWKHPRTGKYYTCGCDGTNREWTKWILLAGRGTGKTRAGAEWTIAAALSEPNIYVAVCAPTFMNVRQTCFEDLQSGIIACAQPGEIEEYNRNDLRIKMRNGSIIRGFSAQNIDSVRGTNLSYCWFDELAGIQYAKFFDYGLEPAMRIRPKSNPPRMVITTTPSKLRLIRDLVEQAETNPNIHITSAISEENPFFDEQALLALRKRYKGTYLEKQELEGILVDGMDGALFSIENFAEHRIFPGDEPEFRRIVVAIDPATTSSDSSDETGIVVAGESLNHDFYVLEDRSLRATPDQCMKTVAEEFHRWEADLVVGENTVGDYMAEALAKQDPNIPYKSVAAMKAKFIRAESISILAAQGRLHMVGIFDELEKQLCSMSSDVERTKMHDDRADACIASGIMVLTSTGEIPIENITVGDRVWTRGGWRPVTATRCTQRNAEVMTVILSDGRELTGTPDHRIWTENSGWRRLDALVYGDRLSAWNPPLKSLIKTSSTDAIPTAPSAVTGSTISITESSRAASVTCTVKSGKTATPARKSPRAGTFITPMRIRSIMSLLTLSCFLLASIRTFIPATARTSQSTWRRFALSLLNGIVPKRDVLGMRSTESTRGMIANQNISVPAVPAESLSLLSGLMLSTARERAGIVKLAKSAGMTNGHHALSAERDSGRTSTALSPRPAVVYVEGSYVNSERRDVYDLSVADVHEFTASGVIVHNCIWALLELSRRGSANYKEMYGFFPCLKCGEDVNQTLDVTCKHCGEPILLKEKEKTRDRSTRWSGAYMRTCEKGHEFPMRLARCPECNQDPNAYLRQVMALTGNNTSSRVYSERNWFTGRKF